MESLLRSYLLRKHPGASEEYIAQREALLQAALGAYTRRSGKVCPTCKEFKALSAFGSDSTRPDGLTASCRQCRR